jgi:hypothetical protein
MLLGKPTLFKQGHAHRPVDFRPSRPKPGLRQILPYSLPARRLSARKVDVAQYEGPNVIERSKHAFAARGAGTHLDRLKSKFAH